MDLQNTMRKVEKKLRLDKPLTLIRMHSTEPGGGYVYLLEAKIIPNYIGDEMRHKPNLEFIDLYGMQEQCFRDCGL